MNLNNKLLNNSKIEKILGGFQYYLLKLVVPTALITVFVQSLFPNQSLIIALVSYLLIGFIQWLKFYSKELRLNSTGSVELLTSFQIFLFHLCLYLLVILLQPLGYILAPIIALALGLLAGSHFTNSDKQEKVVEGEEYMRPDTHQSYSGGSNYYDHNKFEYSVFHTQDVVERPPYTSHGSAHWISDRKKNELTDSINGKPTYNGLWLGGGFFHHKEGNLITVAPPGKGKGASLIIPNLLWERKYSHSFVVFDPKGTNACITARFQKQTGKKVIIIDPMNLQRENNATHGIEPASFNPLEHITDDIYNGCDQIANLLIPEDTNVSDKYWNQEARNLIQTILVHIMTSDKYEKERNLITFYKKLLSPNIQDLLIEIAQNDHVSDNGNRFYDMATENEKLFSSVLTTAASAVKWLNNPSVQKSLTNSDFDPSELEKGNLVIYICTPMRNKESFATFSRLIIGFCLRANLQPTSTSKSWVYYLLDEFPNVGVFPEVIEAMAISREYKIRIWIFAQSLSQLDRIYKSEGREEILGCSNIFQVIGSSDITTQEYVSKRIGTMTVKQATESRGYSKDSSSSFGEYRTTHRSSNESQSTSYSFHGKPLIEPNMIQYDPHIITLTDWGPMRLMKLQYWDQSLPTNYYSHIFEDGRADPNPNFRK